MELRQLEIFRVLAEELNFTRTAERVHCVQSNVTVQIRALENELGVTLFERLGKRVQLTEHGQRLIPYAERVLGLVDEAKAGIHEGSEPQGALRVGAPESVLTYRLPPVLSALRKRYPKIDLSFVAQSCSRMWPMVDRGSIDVAFAIHDVPDLPKLQFEVLCDEPIALLVNPEHELSGKRSLKPADLAGETLLLTEEDCNYRLRLERTLAAAGVQAGSSLTFTSVEAIKECAALGLGVAHLPLVTARAELERNKLKALRWAGGSLTMKTVVAWHKDKWRSAAMKAFLGLVHEHFGIGTRCCR